MKQVAGLKSSFFLFSPACYEGLCSASVVLTMSHSKPTPPLRRNLSFSVKRDLTSPEFKHKTTAGQHLHTYLHTVCACIHVHVCDVCVVCVCVRESVCVCERESLLSCFLSSLFPKQQYIEIITVMKLNCPSVAEVPIISQRERGMEGAAVACLNTEEFNLPWPCSCAGVFVQHL